MAIDGWSSSNYYNQDTTTFPQGTPCSVGCWFYADTSHNGTIYYHGDKDQSDRFWWLRVESDGDVIWRKQRDGTVGQAISTGHYSTSTWHHALGVETSTASRAIYLDGSKDTNSTSVPNSAWDRWAIGYEPKFAGSNFFDGDLAEFCIWNVALSDADATALATGICPLFVRPDQIIYYNPMRRVEDPLRDLWGGGYEPSELGTLTTAPHPPIIYPAGFHLAPYAAAVASGAARQLVNGASIADLVNGGLVA